MSNALNALSNASKVTFSLTILKPDGQSRVPFHCETTVGDIIDINTLSMNVDFDDQAWRDQLKAALDAGNDDLHAQLLAEWQAERNAWLEGGNLTPGELFNQALYEYVMNSETAKAVGLTKNDVGNNPYFTADAMQVTITGVPTNGANVTVTGTAYYGK
jgi:hypothetical protein